MEIADLSMCSGCGACVACCPAGAVDFVTDKLSRRIPEIDVSRCINCGLCVKTCPINQEYFIPEQAKGKCYAMQAKDVRKKECREISERKMEKPARETKTAQYRLYNTFQYLYWRRDQP